MNGQPRPRVNSAPDPGRRGASLAALSLALLLIGLSLAAAIYRLSLPTDGWVFARDATGTGQRLVSGRNLSNSASALRPGDILIAIRGKPYVDILAAALAANPQRPPGWAVGQVVAYTVERDGRRVAVGVRLLSLAPVDVFSNAARNLMIDPAPLITLVIAAYVFYRLPRHGAAQLLLVFSAAVFASSGVTQAVTGSNVLGPAELFSVGAFWPSIFFNSLIWPWLIAPIFVQLTLSFPVQKGPMRRYPRATLAVLYGFMPVLTAGLAIIYRGRPLDLWRTWSVFSNAEFVAVLVTMMVSMLHTLATVREGSKSMQMRWMAWGTIVTSAGALSGNLLISMGLVPDNLLLGWVATRVLLLGYPVALAIAILRYRLFDIDFVVRRTLVYGLVTAALAGLYFASVFISQQIFRGVTGAASPLAQVISTLAIAALFNPVRQVVQELVNRQFYRQKYDLVRALEAFSGSLRDEVELSRLTEDLLAVVSETIQPESVSLWLQMPAVSRRASGEGLPAPAPDEPLGAQLGR